jgi:hypothetical protein
MKIKSKKLSSYSWINNVYVVQEFILRIHSTDERKGG